MLKLHRIAETLFYIAHHLKFLIYVKLHYFQIYQVTQNGWTKTSTSSRVLLESAVSGGDSWKLVSSSLVSRKAL